MRYWLALMAALCGAGIVQAQLPLLKAGVGLGQGFGGPFGAGVEAEWRRVAVLAGVGSFEILSWDAGIRYYFRDAGARIRPHATAAYGAVYLQEYSILVGPETGDYQSLIYGVHLLGGLDHDFGSPGGFVATYGLGVALPGEMPKEDRERLESVGAPPETYDPTVAFSVGIKYQF